MPEEELNNLARIGQLDQVPFSPEQLRKMQVNLSDYDGELVTDVALEECLHQANSRSHMAARQLQVFLNKNTS